MSDDFPKFRFITPAEFARYAGAKGVSGTCPSCGRDDVTLTSHGSGSLANGLAYTREGVALASGFAFEVFPVECGNCGYLWNYNRKTIADWLDANAE